jgi:hypothetical protein
VVLIALASMTNTRDTEFPLDPSLSRTAGGLAQLSTTNILSK